jgi:hypothetical protein
LRSKSTENGRSFWDRPFSAWPMVAYYPGLPLDSCYAMEEDIEHSLRPDGEEGLVFKSSATEGVWPMILGSLADRPPF